MTENITENMYWNMGYIIMTRYHNQAFLTLTPNDNDTVKQLDMVKQLSHMTT